MVEREQQLRLLLKIFLEENEKLNLSALRTEESCWIGNIQDSLAFLQLKDKFPILNSLPGEALAKSGSFSILDVGTGGGFPLLPLAIELPEAQLTGLDATKKKIEAVKRIMEKLKLTNVDVIAGRSEEAGHDPLLREKFDFVLSRAVAELPTLLEYCSPFAKPNGYVVLWKSMTIEEELKSSEHAQKELCLKLVMQHQYSLEGGFGERQLLVFQKIAPLSKKYPRAVGMPKKKPL